MKKLVLLFFILVIGCNTFAQFRESFDPGEAKTLIAICNSYTFLKLYGSDAAIVPGEYKRIYTSEVIGLDNVFQVYKGNRVGVISFRGTTERFLSKMANFYSGMIPAQGVIKIDGRSCPYKFAADTAAAIHSGYALAVVLMGRSLVEQINNLNAKGIYHIFITGHSQGGALAHLSRAWLENLPAGEISRANVFKTYAFANPMCGNEQFATEYRYRYSNLNTSYTVINPADAVPGMPLHLPKKKHAIGSSFFKSIANGIVQGERPNVNDLLAQVFEPALSNQISSGNQMIEKLVASTFMSIDMPDYVSDVNYCQTGSVREVDPFPIPKIPVDTVGMLSEEITFLEQDEYGDFYNPNAAFSQHHPYHYYVAFLRKYFQSDYQKLDMLYLPEEFE